VVVAGRLSRVCGFGRAAAKSRTISLEGRVPARHR
jgi:hypothetical protein